MTAAAGLLSQIAPPQSSLPPAAAALQVSTPTPTAVSSALLAGTPHLVLAVQIATLGHSAAQALLPALPALRAQPLLQQPLPVNFAQLVST